MIHYHCITLRRVKVKSRGKQMIRVRWQTEACGNPLVEPKEVRTGICESCKNGWAHPDNYPANESRPAWERKAV